MDVVLARTGLRFDALVCADDVSVTKPDPEPYLLAAKLLGADPARCVALEDSPNGVASAEAAGCRVIAVPSLVPIEPAPGRTVVRSLLDLRADASGISVRPARVLVWRLGYLRGSRRVRAWVRLPFLTVLKCEIGTRGREASVEGYAVDGLAASGEPAGLAADRGLAELEAAGNAVAPGLGPLVVRVAVMYEGAAGAVLLDDMEHLAVEESRKIGLGALQLAMDAQADAEMPLPGLTGADGERRGCREKSATTVVTMLGRVRVRRIAYRSRKKGVADLHWRDAVLNLPPCGHSWQLQRFAEMACRAGSFQDGHEIVLAATGVSTGKRQLEEIVARAAAGAEEFARDRPVPDAPVITGPGGEERPAVLGMSADAKGVSMRPDALRAETARKAAKRDRKGDKRLGSGEKQAKKRMAETGAVFDSLPPDGEPRTPQDIMLRPAGQPPRTPQALNKWYTCGITATCAEVIAQVMAEPASATRNCSGTGSPSSTATPTRSSASRTKPRSGARRSPS